MASSPSPRPVRAGRRYAGDAAGAVGRACRFLAICLLAILAIAAIPSCKRESSGTAQGDARANREVVLYCSADQAVAEPIIAEFEKRTSVRVLARFDSEGRKTVGLVQRLRAERGSSVADVFWSSEVFHTIRLAREGLLVAYKGSAAENRDAKFADPQGRWYGFALRARVIGYSEKRVPSAEAPQSLEELLEGRWRGRIVMANPQFGTTGGDVASWFAHYGTARARGILTGLKANEVRLVEGNSIAVRMVAMGQADICLTDTDDVYAARRNGWGVGMNYLDQGGDGVLVIPNTVAILAGAPHPAEGRELLEFLLSERVEEMLARSDSHNTPVHPNVAAKFKEYAIPAPLTIDYGKVADRLPEAVRAAGEILR